MGQASNAINGSVGKTQDGAGTCFNSRADQETIQNLLDQIPDG